ncbi:MAG: hypothetical protein PHX10_09000 [Gallionellaceae bacterium]|nr:hypothetical protein [Gallionellaceae bacterium]
MALVLDLALEPDDDLRFLSGLAHLDPVYQFRFGLTDAPENQTTHEREADWEPTQPIYHLLKNLHWWPGVDRNGSC